MRRKRSFARPRGPGFDTLRGRGLDRLAPGLECAHRVRVVRVEPREVLRRGQHLDAGRQPPSHLRRDSGFVQSAESSRVADCAAPPAPASQNLGSGLGEDDDGKRAAHLPRVPRRRSQHRVVKHRERRVGNVLRPTAAPPRRRDDRRVRAVLVREHPNAPSPVVVHVPDPSRQSRVAPRVHPANLRAQHDDVLGGPGHLEKVDVVRDGVGVGDEVMRRVGAQWGAHGVPALSLGANVRVIRARPAERAAARHVLPEVHVLGVVDDRAGPSSQAMPRDARRRAVPRGRHRGGHYGRTIRRARGSVVGIAANAVERYEENDIGPRQRGACLTIGARPKTILADRAPGVHNTRADQTSRPHRSNPLRGEYPSRARGRRARPIAASPPRDLTATPTVRAEGGY